MSRECLFHVFMDARVSVLTFEITTFPVWTDTIVEENYGDPAYCGPAKNDIRRSLLMSILFLCLHFEGRLSASDKQRGHKIIIVL